METKHQTNNINVSAATTPDNSLEMNALPPEDNSHELTPQAGQGCCGNFTIAAALRPLTILFVGCWLIAMGFLWYNNKKGAVWWSFQIYIALVGIGMPLIPIFRSEKLREYGKTMVSHVIACLNEKLTWIIGRSNRIQDYP